MINHSNRNFGLDCIRATAISFVLLSHFVHEKFEILGFFGVELFFGLSGFLIGKILWRNFSESNIWSFKKVHNFWSRRWWRTLPNYYLFIFLILGFNFFTDKSLIPPLSDLLKYFWFGQYLLSRNQTFFSVSWSLCIEEWFYLIFPLTLLLLSKFKLSQKTIFSSAIIIFHVAALLIKLWLIHQNANSPVREITLARLDAICSGVLIAFCTSINYINVKNKFYLFLTGLILIFSPAFFVLTHFIVIQSIVQNIPFLTITPLGFAMCLPFISDFKTANNIPAFISQSITKLSLYSYSIYLSHIPIMFITYGKMSHIRQSGSLGNLASKIVALVLTFLVSAFVYKFFEVPLTQRRPREIKA